MKENKLSPVEWLVEELTKAEYIDRGSTITNYVIGIAKEMEQEAKNKFPDFSNVTRFEVINHSKEGTGREYTKYGVKVDEFQIQDEGKTLKVFLK